MIICLCQVVSDRQVRALVAAGARTVTEVGRLCGAGTGCGGCRKQLARCIEQARSKSLDAQPACRACCERQLHGAEVTG